MTRRVRRVWVPPSVLCVSHPPGLRSGPGRAPRSPVSPVPETLVHTRTGSHHLCPTSGHRGTPEVRPFFRLGRGTGVSVWRGVCVVLLKITGVLFEVRWTRWVGGRPGFFCGSPVLFFPEFGCPSVGVAFGLMLIEHRRCESAPSVPTRSGPVRFVLLSFT